MATKRKPEPAVEPKPRPPKACGPPPELPIFLDRYLELRFSLIDAQLDSLQSQIDALSKSITIRLTASEKRIMAKVKDTAEKIEAAADAAIERVRADVQALRDKIDAAGEVSPEDQATFDRIEAKLAALDPEQDATVDDVPPAPEDTGDNP